MFTLNAYAVENHSHVARNHCNAAVSKQKSPAVADKPAKRESVPKNCSNSTCLYNVVADNTGLSSFAQLLLRLKSAKSQKNL